MGLFQTLVQQFPVRPFVLVLLGLQLHQPRLAPVDCELFFGHRLFRLDGPSQLVDARLCIAIQLDLVVVNLVEEFYEPVGDVSVSQVYEWDMLDYNGPMVATYGPEVTVPHDTVAELVEHVHANSFSGSGHFQLPAFNDFDFPDFDWVKKGIHSGASDLVPVNSMNIWSRRRSVSGVTGERKEYLGSDLRRYL